MRLNKVHISYIFIATGLLGLLTWGNLSLKSGKLGNTVPLSYLELDAQNSLRSEEIALLRL